MPIVTIEELEDYRDAVLAQAAALRLYIDSLTSESTDIGSNPLPPPPPPPGS